MRILIITSKFPRFPNDPQPPFVFYYARELVRLGHEVAVVAPHDRSCRREEVMEGIKIFRYQYFIPESAQKLSYGPGIPANVHKSLFSMFQMPFFIVSQILKSRAVSKRFRPDVVHAHWGFPQGLSAKFTGRPYYVNFYGGEMFLAKKFRMVWMLDYIVKHSKKSFTVTNFYLQLLRQFGFRQDLEIIPLGVNVDNFKPKSEGYREVRKRFCKRGELLVLFVGRLVEKKGANYLVEAFAKVARQVPKARLVIVGTGPMESGLKAQAKTLGLGDRIVFEGEISNSNLPAYYSAADVFVLPSVVDRHGDREGQGVVYLEAMACKIPVIGTKTGGIPDVVNPDVGILVEEKDSSQLAEAIVRLLKNSKLRKSMGEKAYKHVHSHFTWSYIAGKYVDIFRGKK